MTRKEAWENGWREVSAARSWLSALKPAKLISRRARNVNNINKQTGALTTNIHRKTSFNRRKFDDKMKVKAASEYISRFTVAISATTCFYLKLLRQSR